MNIRKSLLLLIFIFPLSAFSYVKTNPHGNEKKWDMDIVFIGNSITLGVTLADRGKDAPPVIACKYLQSQSQVGDVKIFNNGKNGSTTVDFLPSTGRLFSELVAAANQLHTDKQRLLVFSISLGTNDSANDGTNGAPVSPKAYYANLEAIADQLLSSFPDCKIIFQQPIWYSPNTYNGARYLAEGLARLQSYFPELESLVDHYSRSNPDQVFMGDKKGFKYFKKNYLTDMAHESGKQGIFYLHPNKKGAEMLGSLWGEAIYNRLIQ